MKSQSAMEYLMTYGWAILIIAVVLGILFQLGVFSSGNFQPHAQAGSCQVSRTAVGVSLEGQCNGLLPEYVVYSPGGSSSQQEITVAPSSSLLSVNTQNTVTITVWYKLTQTEPGETFIATSGDELRLAVQQGATPYTDMGTHNDQSCSNTEQAGQWYFAAFSKSASSGADAIIYLNGTACGTFYNDPAVSVSNVNPLLGIGYEIAAGDGKRVYGYISNIQIYNTSLSSSEIQTPYLEGIGGAPIRPQNLVAWWPLNGNANDYSGNGNNGQLEGGVSFSSSWESGYTAP